MNTTLLPPTIHFIDYEIKLIGTFDNIWMCAYDICNILQYKQSSYKHALSRHVDEIDRMTRKEIAGKYNIKDSINGHGDRAIYINEYGLMDLVCSCRIKTARDFKIFIIREFASMKSNLAADLAVDEYKKSILPSEESIEDMIEETLTEETVEETITDTIEESIEDPTDTTDKNVNEPYDSMMLILECENEMLKSKLETCKDIIKSKNEMIKLLEERIV